MTMGEFIKQIRQWLGMTQKELAAKAGISYQQLSQYERGVRSPKDETLDKIVKAMGFYFPEFMRMYYGSLTRVSEEDQEILEILDRLAPSEKEQLEPELDALRQLMNANGYDLGRTRGEYYLVGKDGAYHLTEDQLQSLLNGTVQYIESLCKMLESTISGYPYPGITVPPDTSSSQPPK